MESIELYSTHCPKCIMLESQLKSKKIKYKLITEFNIEDIKAKGFLSMPVLNVDGNFMDFNEAVKWVKKR